MPVPRKRGRPGEGPGNRSFLCFSGQALSIGGPHGGQHSGQHELAEGARADGRRIRGSHEKTAGQRFHTPPARQREVESPSDDRERLRRFDSGEHVFRAGDAPRQIFTARDLVSELGIERWGVERG